MNFEEILDHAIAMLQRRGRVTYRTLKRQFQLDDDVLEDLKEELIYGQRLAADEDGRVLVWMGDASTSPALIPSPPPHEEEPPATLHTRAASLSVELRPADAERRQLTVLFCDLVDSTALAGQLDPEELREVVRAYQETCAKVIARFEGHIAQYLGDGLLVYFGYPLAHEDDAQRAVRAGLGMVEALGPLNTRLGHERGIHLAVRLGIHTGLVVVGEVGGGTRQEQLALGETPNLAARLQSMAAPNTLVISAATLQLLGGFFAYQSLGTRPVKGIAQPPEVYQVLYESTARSRLEAAGSTGLTPLVGREQEVGLLRERWAQVKDGLGQVVLLSGEAGIGKSRLVQVLKEQVAMLHYSRREGQATQERAEAGMSLASEKGFPQYLALGMIMRGWALAVQGQGEEGIAQIHQGLAVFRAAGAEISRSRDLGLLAEAYGEMGQTEEGLTVLAEALAVVDKTGERYWEAELHRLKGELLLRRASPTEEVEACFRQALAVAQHQQAKSLELRAAMSLARLWERQGKRAAAHELLAPIYGWFTEGFDTPDLQEARALLEELS